jgi:hypothetical protein
MLPYIMYLGFKGRPITFKAINNYTFTCIINLLDRVMSVASLKLDFVIERLTPLSDKLITNKLDVDSQVEYFVYRIRQ